MDPTTFIAEFAKMQNEITNLGARAQAAERRADEMEARHRTDIDEINAKVAKNTRSINYIICRALLDETKRKILDKYNIPEDAARPGTYTRLPSRLKVVAAANAMWRRLSSEDKKILTFRSVKMLVDSDPDSVRGRGNYVPLL